MSVAKLTIQDVFEMFEVFGISSARVNRILDNCKDRSQAFNVFEGLKAQVTIRYEDMRAGEVSAERFQEIKPTYERLMKISLKSYKPKPKKPDPKQRQRIHDTNTFRRMARVGEMIQNKDVDGLMRMLDTDSEDPKERAAAEKILHDFAERMRKK